jgi:hypothetical protein
MKLSYIDELTALKRNYLHLKGEMLKLSSQNPLVIVEIGNGAKVTDRELVSRIREEVMRTYTIKMQEMEAKLQLIGVDDFTE